MLFIPFFEWQNSQFSTQHQHTHNMNFTHFVYNFHSLCTLCMLLFVWMVLKHVLSSQLTPTQWHSKCLRSNYVHIQWHKTSVRCLSLLLNGRYILLTWDRDVLSPKCDCKQLKCEQRIQHQNSKKMLNWFSFQSNNLAWAVVRKSKVFTSLKTITIVFGCVFWNVYRMQKMCRWKWILCDGFTGFQVDQRHLLRIVTNPNSRIMGNLNTQLFRANISDFPWNCKIVTIA